jgi:Asp-tRNA(Asn)/Glu-tRNA(Gln) amidotransferase A subunit family amidase
MDTQDFPTEMGSPIYRGFRPRGDAAVVMMLKQAGASIIGKTTTTALPRSIRRRRSIRAIMVIRPADRHRVRRRRSRPA